MVVSSRIEVVYYDFEEIFIIDYSDLDCDQAERLARQFRDFVFGSGKTDFLIVVDVTNTKVNRQLFERLKKISKEIEPYVKKRCVVGLNGLHRTLLTFYNNALKKGAKAVKSYEEAKNYLVD